MPPKIDDRIVSMCDQLSTKHKLPNAPSIALSAVRDEQDILERFVRHTLGCVDGMLIINHEGSDASRDILVSLFNEGLPLCFLNTRELGFHQSGWLTDLAAAAANRLGAQVIIPLDADEFLQRPDGGDVRDYLSTISRDDVRLISWRSYIPLESASNDEPDILRRITSRLAVSPRIQKVLVGGRVAAQDSFRIGYGSHEVIVGVKKVECSRDRQLILAHFPVRSVAQFVAKVAVARITIPLVPERSPNSGIHYEWLRSSTSISLSMSSADLRRAAIQYGSADDSRQEVLVLDPVLIRGGALKYSDGRPGDPVARIEKIARDLATQRPDNLNGSPMQTFIEAKILAENERMRAELASVRAGRLWRAFTLQRLRNLMKAKG